MNSVASSPEASVEVWPGSGSEKEDSLVGQASMVASAFYFSFNLFEHFAQRIGHFLSFACW